ncbi:MAG TPA: hypothetical protein VGK79_16470 [Gaiellaceae bacterium]
MAKSKKASILNEFERQRADDIGARTYIRSRRYRYLRERHVFAALDSAVAAMQALRFTNPYDGHVLAALASVMIRNDPKAIGLLRGRRVSALNDPAERDELFRFAGCLVAEDYLNQRRDQIPDEPLLTSSDQLIDGLDELFAAMEATGAAMGREAVTKEEMVVTFENDDPTLIARGMVVDAIAGYESLVPELDDRGAVPASVERRSISRAAFLRLAVDDLRELAAGGVLPEVASATKAELVRALTDRYGDDIDEVARLVLRDTGRDPGFGLVTRLQPLENAPNLEATATVLRGLRGHYLEVKAAVFFVFREVTAEDDGTLRIAGRIRSFAVVPAEVAGEIRMSPRPHSEDVTVVLRPDQPWAEVSVHRPTDLVNIATVLRRTGEVRPSTGVVPPDPLLASPYATWDTRTLWLLDLLRRDLQAVELRLEDTVMANFVSPREDAPLVDEEGRRIPAVQSVRLHGQLLHDHPEACARIAARAHMKDLEMSLAVRVDANTGETRFVRVRLSWEPDHLAVLTAADVDRLNVAVHQQLVRIVRAAAHRRLDEVGLAFTLRQIEKKATGQSLSPMFPSVADEDDAETVVPASRPPSASRKPRIERAVPTSDYYRRQAGGHWLEPGTARR